MLALFLLKVYVSKICLVNFAEPYIHFSHTLLLNNTKLLLLDIIIYNYTNQVCFAFFPAPSAPDLKGNHHILD